MDFVYFDFTLNFIYDKTQRMFWMSPFVCNEKKLKISEINNKIK